MINATTGEYESEVKVGTSVQKVLLAVGVAGLLLTSLWALATSPASVTLTSKDWECTASDTIGIRARCTEYRLVSNRNLLPTQ